MKIIEEREEEKEDRVWKACHRVKGKGASFVSCENYEAYYTHRPLEENEAHVRTRISFPAHVEKGSAHPDAS